jgi:hypothetical protein
MEMSGWAATLNGAPLFCGLWPSNAPANRPIEAEIAFTKASGRKSLYIHVDSVAQEARAFAGAETVKAADLLPILGAHAVLDAAAFEAQAGYFAAEAKTRGWAWGITLNACLGWDGAAWLKDPDRFIDELLPRVERVIRTVPGCRCLWAFGVYTHLVFEHLTDLRPFFVDLVAAITPPAHYPGDEPVVVPPVDADPPPTPGPSPIDPGRGHWRTPAQVAADIVAEDEALKPILVEMAKPGGA